MVKPIVDDTVIRAEDESKYQNLFEISPKLLEEMKHKSLGILSYESNMKSLELTREGNRLSFDSKRGSSKNLDRVIKEKIAAYERVVKNIVLPIIEVFAEIFGELFGAGLVKGIMIASKAAVRSASQQMESSQNQEITGFDHEYRTEEQLLEQHKRTQQEFAQFYAQLLEIFKQSIQQIQENARMILAVV